MGEAALKNSRVGDLARKNDLREIFTKQGGPGWTYYGRSGVALINRSKSRAVQANPHT